MPTPKVVKRTTTTVEEYLDVETGAEELEHDDAEEGEEEEQEEDEGEEEDRPRRKRR